MQPNCIKINYLPRLVHLFQFDMIGDKNKQKCSQSYGQYCNGRQLGEKDELDLVQKKIQLINTIQLSSTKLSEE